MVRSSRSSRARARSINNQRGGSGAHGRTVLPAEYFGGDSKAYHAPGSPELSLDYATAYRATDDVGPVARAGLAPSNSRMQTGGGARRLRHRRRRRHRSSQRGGSGAHGHTALPAEYFGGDSKVYFAPGSPELSADYEHAYKAVDAATRATSGIAREGLAPSGARTATGGSQRRSRRAALRRGRARRSGRR